MNAVLAFPVVVVLVMAAVSGLSIYQQLLAVSAEVERDRSRERELRARFNVCPHCPHVTWHNGDPCPSKETGK